MFAKVFAAKSLQPGAASVAVKVVKLTNPIMAQDHTLAKRKRFEAEAGLWRKVSHHENIAEFKEVFLDAAFGRMVMERCEGTLMDLLERSEWCWSIAFLGGGSDLAQHVREMCAAVAHVHSCGVLHRDVKPDNFLLGGPECKTVKLTDFGFSIAEPRGGIRLVDHAGTEAYMSPEMAKAQGYGTQTDLWSLGVSCYLIFFGGIFPYSLEAESHNGHRSRNRSLTDAIADGRVLPSFRLSQATRRYCKQPPPTAVSLVQQMLDRDAQNRCTAKGALEHAFMDPTCKFLPEAANDVEDDLDSTCSTQLENSFGGCTENVSAGPTYGIM